MIEVGDTVRVLFATGQNLTDEKNICSEYVGKVLHVSQETGDMWKFDIDGYIVYINPICIDFKGLVLLEKKPYEEIPF